MSRKIINDNKRDLCKSLYLAGETIADISNKIDVSRQTISKWVTTNNWAELRAAKSITRKELVMKLLNSINDKINSGDWNPDQICKAAAAIERLDKQTNVVTIIEVFTAFSQWLIARVKIDSELTPEMVKIINHYQDVFINESISSINNLSVR